MQNECGDVPVAMGNPVASGLGEISSGCDMMHGGWKSGGLGRNGAGTGETHCPMHPFRELKPPGNDRSLVPPGPREKKQSQSGFLDPLRVGSGTLARIGSAFCFLTTRIFRTFQEHTVWPEIRTET